MASENISLRGDMVDMAPGEQTAWMPDDESLWPYLRGATDSSFISVTVFPWHGEPLQADAEQCDGSHLVRSRHLNLNFSATIQTLPTEGTNNVVV